MLAWLVSTLPEDDEQRAKLADKIRNDLPRVSDVMFTRLSELDQRIEQQYLEMRELTGVDPVHSVA